MLRSYLKKSEEIDIVDMHVFFTVILISHKLYRTIYVFLKILLQFMVRSKDDQYCLTLLWKNQCDSNVESDSHKESKI